MAPKKIAIQITDTSANILIGNKKNITISQSIALKEGICVDGKIVDKSRLVTALKNFLDVNGRNAKKVSFILRGSDIITRYIEVPIMKDEALRETVYYEFNQFIPAVNEYYMDYEIVEKVNTKEKKAYKILLVAATKEKIDPLIDISQEIGKKLDVIDILSNSMSRVIKNSDIGTKENSVGLFYFGVNSSTLSIIEDKILKIERTLPFGVINIFRDIDEEVDRKYVDKSKMQSILQRNPRIRASIDNLLASISNTIRYYNSDRKNKPINRFVIVCGDTFIEGLDEYWEGYFELPCILVKKPSDLDLRVKIENNFEKNVVNYGLFLREKNTNLLNLNPGFIKKTQIKSDMDRTLVSVISIVLSGLIIIGGALFFVNRSLNNKIALVEEEIGKYADVIAINNQLKVENDSMDLFLKQIDNIKANNIEVSNVITKLNTYIPKAITFVNLTFDESGVLNLIGESNTYDAIPEFLANLQMSDEFQQSVLSYINPIERTVVIGTKTILKESGEELDVEAVPEYETVDITQTLKVFSFSISVEGVTSHGTGETKAE